MIWFIIIAIAFLSLLILPFAVSLAFVKKSQDASLNIKYDNARDPRYFSKSFCELVDKGISEEEGTIKLSRVEPYVIPRDMKDEICDNIVYAKEKFASGIVKEFKKEIYTKMSAEIAPMTKLRAIACRDTLVLDEKCEVLRWADADMMLTAQKGCYLGISTTSAKRLLVNVDCVFRRLFAPEIHIGDRVTKTVFQFAGLKIIDEALRDIKSINDDKVVENTIITNHNLEIGERVVIYGSVKTSKRLIVRKDTIIMGNVISDGVMILEDNVKIAGNVFSQDSIFVGSRVQIGVKPKIKSIVAKNDIVLCESSEVFGYVGCERDGRTVTKEQFDRILDDRDMRASNSRKHRKH